MLWWMDSDSETDWDSNVCFFTVFAAHGRCRKDIELLAIVAHGGPLDLEPRFIFVIVD